MEQKSDECFLLRFFVHSDLDGMFVSVESSVALPTVEQVREKWTVR